MNRDFIPSSNTNSPRRISKQYFSSEITRTPLNKEGEEPMHHHEEGSDNQEDKDSIVADDENAGFSERDERYQFPHSALGNVGDEVPENHTQRQDCCSCEVKANNDDPKEFSYQSNVPLGRNMQSMTRLEHKGAKLEVAFRTRGYDSNVAVRSLQEQEAAQILLRSMHLVNLVAIRQRWQTLRQYRAWDRWRKTIDDGTKNANECTTGTAKIDEHSIQKLDTVISKEQVCPPLHTRTRPARESKKHLVGRVQDVVAAVVATDAICCSVVQEFVFPQRTETFDLPIRQPHSTMSASLLELLAASSEFDRPNIRPNRTEDNAEDEHRRFELESVENWCFAEEEELTSEKRHEALSLKDTPIILEDNPLCSLSFTSPHVLNPSTTRNPVHATLSVCVDSIDMARRALGPSMHKLRWCDKVSDKFERATGIEREMLSFLDKRLAVMSQHIEELLSALQDASPSWAPSRVSCDALETMVGEFCLQIIARVCDQLPSASSGCVAGRLQLEVQLEQFNERLKTQLLPAVAREGHANNYPTTRNEHEFNTIFSVAVELLAISERVKLVWYLTDHTKRQRLLHAQALKAATFNISRMVKTIATLEMQNAELVAKCNALASKSIEVDTTYIHAHAVSLDNQISSRGSKCHHTNTDLRMDGSSDTVVGVGNDIDDKLAGQGTREERKQNDELLRQFTTLNHKLAAATVRIDQLETENGLLCSSVHDAQDKNAALSTSLAIVNEDLANALEQPSQIESECSRHQATIADLQIRLNEAQTEQESAATAAEEAELRFTALKKKMVSQINEISVLERRIQDDDQTLFDLESKLSTVVQERDEGVLLLSHTEEALITLEGNEKELQLQLEKHSARESEKLSCLQAELDRSTLEVDSLREELTHALSTLEFVRQREKELENQLEMNSTRELEEMNRLREELLKVTLEGASVREELTELLDHSTLQSAAMDTLKSEQIETAKQLQKWNLEREELELRCQTEHTLSEQREKERDEALLHAQQLEEIAMTMEKQQKTSRQECLTMHETLQHQADTFQSLQTLHEANSCSIIRNLERQIDNVSSEIRRLESKLKAKEAEVEDANETFASRLEILMEKAQLSEKKLLKAQHVSSQLTQQLQTCRLDLSGSTLRWVQAETQCAILRISMRHLNNKKNEEVDRCSKIEDKKSSKEVAKMRAMVVRMKEALDAKDDILLFLDGKVADLEKVALEQ